MIEVYRRYGEPMHPEGVEMDSTWAVWREKRTYNGKPIGDLIHIAVEDDGNWHHQDSFDEAHLPGLIECLQRIKEAPHDR